MGEARAPRRSRRAGQGIGGRQGDRSADPRREGRAHPGAQRHQFDDRRAGGGGVPRQAGWDGRGDRRDRVRHEARPRAHGRGARRWARSRYRPADYLRSGLAAAHARLRAVHPRADASARLGDAGHDGRRAAHRFDRRRARNHEVVHAALQLPPLHDRGSEAGTRDGVTSIQMDIKVERLDWSVISQALEKARKARVHILDIMQQAMPHPRSQLSKYAPRIITIQIRPDKIGDLIGPKGKTIRGIQEQTGAEINVDDSGLVTIAGVGEAAERARDMVSGIVQEPEVGKVYEGVVKSTTAFGAFVEIIPGVEGLLHISELQHGRTEKTEDVVKKGDHLKVKLLEVDERGRMRLSRKALIEKN